MLTGMRPELLLVLLWRREIPGGSEQGWEPGRTLPLALATLRRVSHPTHGHPCTEKGLAEGVQLGAHHNPGSARADKRLNQTGRSKGPC